MLLTFTVSASIAGMILFYTINKNVINNRIYAQMSSVVSLKKDMLDFSINHDMPSLKTLSNSDFLRENTDMLINGNNIEKKSAEKALSDEIKEYQNFSSVSIINNDGIVIYSSVQSLMGKNRSDYQYFKEAKNKTYVQAFYVELATNKITITIAEPVKNKEGILLGIMAADIDTGDISNAISESTGLGETSATYLVNDINYIVTQSKTIESAQFTQTNYSSGVNKCLKGIDNHGIYTDYNGNEVIGEYKWLPDYKMCLVAEVGTKEAFASTYRYRNMCIIYTIVTIILVYLLSRGISILITKPVLELNEATKTIGGGDLKKRINVTRKDELGELGRSFNKMADDIEKKTARLELYNEHLIMEDRVKTEFISIASHELLTPTSVIEGYLSMILDDKMAKIDKKGELYLNKVLTSSKKLAFLVKELLDVSRIEEGRIQIQWQAFDLTKLICEEIDDLKLQAKNKHLTLRFQEKESQDKKEIMVFADQSRTKEILTNLLTNAIKYSQKGAIDISCVQKPHESENGRMVEVAIKDHGIGIPEEDQRRIFRKFFRAVNANDYGAQGTGLGLYISKSFVHLMGGKLWFDSKYKKGTTFFFTLKIATAEQIKSFSKKPEGTGIIPYNSLNAEAKKPDKT